MYVSMAAKPHHTIFLSINSIAKERLMKTYRPDRRQLILMRWEIRNGVADGKSSKVRIINPKGILFYSASFPSKLR